MDLFDMLSINSESSGVAPQPQKAKNKNDVKKEAKLAKAEKEKAAKAAKANKIVPKTLDVNQRLVTMDWTVHYAAHNFNVSDLARVLVSMEDADLEAVKAAVFVLVPQDVKDALAAAQLRAATASPVSEELQEAADESEEETEEDEELETDEESEEVRVAQPKLTPASTPVKEAEVTEGDITVDMLRQALAQEYFEFADGNSVKWRVDTENKRLFPSISAGKMGSASHTLFKGTFLKDFFWKWSDYLATENKKSSNIVAGNDGQLYEIRESDHLRVVTMIPHIRELDEIKEGIVLKRAKISGLLLLQTLNFFKHMAQWRLEALVYITYNKVTQTYELHCPKQKVNGITAEAEYADRDLDTDIVVIMHSHHTMPAFFSDQDNSNDQALCVYGVFGNLLGDIQWMFRAGFNGRHSLIHVNQIFENADVEDNGSFPQEWLQNVERTTY